ncbi:MAG TPA: chromosome segregation protein SMC [Halomonas sp.]|uniref:AAA family ATPase n=1 Tax=Halomonadaceae TaxID=28256 RepID=UPI000E9706F9|nr:MULTISPECIES: ATP-binding protein [unclassified Halomonas]HBP40767.1 chromosome segregation protein SMC [Halomonas sp.]HBS82995.1 chromosome segregation protein SMC [Halomonas campaniensis]
MIHHIRIDNFKSLVDFEIGLSRFSCLVGLNGAGKSTVLQALDFISQQMRGDIDGWLEQRQWEPRDLGSKLTAKQNIDISVQIETEEHVLIEWSASFNRHSLRCTKEEVISGEKQLLKVEDGEFFLDRGFGPVSWRQESQVIMFDYQGSILSRVKHNHLVHELQVLKESLTNIRSLDLLSPEHLRQRARDSAGHLGLGGQKLSAYLHEQGGEVRQRLLERLQHAYPQLASIDTRSLRSGWKHLDIAEQFNGKVLNTPARHVNDGLLRLLAVLSQLASDEHFLLFDEIENGINPELVEFLVDALVESEHQVMVTTHSPVILNYLEDEVAKQGVIYLYKNAKGATQSIRLFEIPSLAEKLRFMGPGEAFIDTQLTELATEIQSLSAKGGKDASAAKRRRPK